MALMHKFASRLLCLFAFLICVSAIEASDATNGSTSATTAVFLNNTSAFAVCVYPTSVSSGRELPVNFSFETRRTDRLACIGHLFLPQSPPLLLYPDLLLFSRAHLWLVAGATAAALTYSGSAAVHACLLVWRGPNPYIENDSWVLYSILNAACLITVPLLNWSGTLRRLGAKAASIRDPKGNHTQSDVSTRAIVIYWAFLVLVGFICIWQQVHYGDGDTDMEYPDLSKVRCAPGTNASMLLGADGNYYRRAIDIHFVQANDCTDLCSQVNIPSIFRQQNDLVPLDHQKALLWTQTLPGSKYERTYKRLEAADKLFNLDYYTLPFILVQGFVSVLFGRRDPREIRDLIYIRLFLQWPSSTKPFLHRTHDILVRFLAALNYILAVAVILLCPPLFIITLISSEFQFWQEPDAEAPYAVGQWEPWAITCQVLLAALIGRYHDRAVSFIGTFWRRISTRRQDAAQAADDEHGTIPLSPATNANPLAGKPDVPANERPTISPLQPFSTKGKTKSLWGRLAEQFHHGYQMLAHPLNQSDRGLFDEIKNFWHWCRDPQAVSRLVIRHPIRPGDADRRERGYGAGISLGEKEGKGSLDEEGWGENKGNIVNGQGERLDSGFFRAASVDRKGRHTLPL